MGSGFIRRAADGWGNRQAGHALLYRGLVRSLLGAEEIRFRGQAGGRSFSRLVNIYIDVDKNYDAIAVYKVRGIPAIFFLNPGGEIVERVSGDRSVAGFVKQITAVAQKHTR
jgi:hypothetical protein